MKLHQASTRRNCCEAIVNPISWEVLREVTIPAETPHKFSTTSNEIRPHRELVVSHKPHTQMQVLHLSSDPLRTDAPHSPYTAHALTVLTPPTHSLALPLSCPSCTHTPCALTVLTPHALITLTHTQPSQSSWFRNSLTVQKLPHE